MSRPTNETAPGVCGTEGNSLTNDTPMVSTPPRMEQATLFDALGIDAPSDLVADILAEHSNSPDEGKQGYIGDARRAFLYELAKAPCTLSEARLRHGIRPPAGVDGRAAGVVPHELHAQGIIRPAGYSKNPWHHCHRAIAQIWELVEQGVPA